MFKFQSLKDRFKSAPLVGAEKILKDKGVKYKKQPDGTLLVPGNLDFSFQDLAVLPDLSSVVVRGYFTCYRNKLTSLKGAPRSVGGNFNCGRNLLASLEGTLQTVGGTIDCRGNRLETLGGVIPGFRTLNSDLGKFSSLAEAPGALLLSAAERARQVAETPENAPALQEHLRWAALTGDTETVIAAIRKGADPKAADGSLLMAVAAREDKPMAVALLVAGADIEQSLHTLWKKIGDCESWDEDGGYITKPEEHARYTQMQEWLSKNKAGLLQDAMAQKLAALTKTNAALEKKAASLQQALDAADRPKDIGKPKLSAPKAF